MKRMNKRRLLLPLLLLLSTLLVLSLIGCTKAGNDTIYTKEELLENVTRASGEQKSFVWRYLDEWDFPTFAKNKIRRVEVLFRDEYYEDLPDTLTLATATATTFLDVYYDEIDLRCEEEVTDALIKSYAGSIGDKYSFYRTKEEYDSYSSGLSGNFVGIGVTVTYDKTTGILSVIEVMEGGGAADAGMLVGDVITSVDGVSVETLGYDAAVNKIRGEENTTVTLGIKRGDGELSLTVARRYVEEKSVKYSLKDGIGYIEISSFKLNTDEQFIEAVDYMTENGARGVIYDLRGNTGGYLSSVTGALDYIAPKGTTISTFSNDYDDDCVAKSEHTFLIPSVVLCDGYTASAGELFTSGIRDFAEMELLEAVIVGTKTYGKGVMQSSYTFQDGSAVTLTVAYYTSPLGENYNGKGIEPNLPVERTEGEDNQLAAAYESITNLINNN